MFPKTNPIKIHSIPKCYINYDSDLLDHPFHENGLFHLLMLFRTVKSLSAFLPTVKYIIDIIQNQNLGQKCLFLFRTLPLMTWTVVLMNHRWKNTVYLGFSTKTVMRLACVCAQKGGLGFLGVGFCCCGVSTVKVLKVQQKSVSGMQEITLAFTILEHLKQFLLFQPVSVFSFYSLMLES